MSRRRSDPKKLAADRQEIMRSLEGFERRERVTRSQAKAKADAAAFKATGEGTMGEAFQHTFDEAANRRYVKRNGGPPELEGAVVTGLRKNNRTS